MKPNMQNIMKQAQQMQAQMARVQDELKDERVSASVGGGVVRVEMSGDLRVTNVVIDPTAVDPDDVHMLEDLVEAAVNEVLRMAQEVASTKMQSVTGGMSIPGMM